MNDYIDLAEHTMHVLNDFLSTPTALRALVFGLLLSWMGTQLIKFVPAIQQLADRDNRLGVRAVAFAIGCVAVLALWEAPWAPRIGLGVIVGLASPFVYKVVVLCAYHFAPWLEPKLSGKPGDRTNDPEL